MTAIADKKINVEEAVKLSRLEVDYQVIIVTIVAATTVLIEFLQWFDHKTFSISGRTLGQCGMGSWYRTPWHNCSCCCCRYFHSV